MSEAGYLHSYDVAPMLFMEVIEVEFTLDGDDIGHHDAAGT